MRRCIRRQAGHICTRDCDTKPSPTPPTSQSRLAALSGSLSEIEALRPTTGSVFVRAFLGQVNVRAATSKDREKLRDEYNKFKDRTNMGEAARCWWCGGVSCYV